MKKIQIVASNITHGFAEHDLFCHVSLKAQPGEVLQIIGPNGSGKTTLLRMLAGLNRSLEGDIQWIDANDCQVLNSDERRQAVLYIGHQHGLLPGLNVSQSIQYLCALFQKHNMSLVAVKCLLKKWGLEAHSDQRVESLSFGQQKRLGLCRLSLQAASAWILDEPWVGLDHKTISLLFHLISDYTERGGNVVLTTHQRLSKADSQPNWKQFDLGKFTANNRVL